MFCSILALFLDVRLRRRLIPPTSRKHMQACKHNLRGSKKKFGFMSTVTNPQVSSNERHTLQWEVLFIQVFSLQRERNLQSGLLLLHPFFFLHFTSLCQSLFVASGFAAVTLWSGEFGSSAGEWFPDCCPGSSCCFPAAFPPAAAGPCQHNATHVSSRPAATLNKSHTSLLPCWALSLKVGEGVIHLSVSGAQLCRVHTLRSHGCRR